MWRVEKNTALGPIEGKFKFTWTVVSDCYELAENFQNTNICTIEGNHDQYVLAEPNQTYNLYRFLPNSYTIYSDKQRL